MRLCHAPHHLSKGTPQFGRNLIGLKSHVISKNYYPAYVISKEETKNWAAF